MARRFFKVSLSRSLSAKGKITVGNMIQVNFEDLIFSVAPADFDSQHSFFELARKCLICAQKGQFHQLLRDAAAAGKTFVLLQGVVHGSKHANRIDARMMIEIGVFDSERCVDEVVADAGQGHNRAPPGIIGENLVEEIALTVVDGRGLEGVGAVPEFIWFGQGGGNARVCKQKAAQCHQHQRQA